MNRAWVFVAVLVASLVASAGRASAADEKEAVGKAAKAWANAMKEGDAAAIKATSAGTEDEVARFQGNAKLGAAFRALSTAAEAKYGEQAAMLSRFNKQQDFAQLVNESTIEVNGAEATITSKDNKALKLKKQANNWKVDLSSLPPESRRMDPKQLAGMTSAVTTTTDEIKANKHATFQDALIALSQRMKAAGGAGGQPVNKPPAN
jgi:hypothetical protein